MFSFTVTVLFCLEQISFAEKEVHLDFADLAMEASSFCCGSHHTCALSSHINTPRHGGVNNVGESSEMDTGQPLCWGRDNLQQTDAPDEQDFVQLSCGGSYTCGLTAEERVQCWGGIGGDLKGQFIQVSSGLDHTCALSLSGTISCMGRNSRGEASPPSADSLPEGERFVQVSAGKSHSCALTNMGSVVCWGSNEKGQCNVPTSLRSFETGDEDETVPVTFKQVVASFGKHSCAIESDTGFARCWGAGQGSSRSSGASPPKDVAFSALAAGRKFTCGLKKDNGQVICWGRIANVPNVVDGPFVQLSAGEEHACASTAMGELRCWGKATYAKTAIPDKLRVIS